MNDRCLPDIGLELAVLPPFKQVTHCVVHRVRAKLDFTGRLRPTIIAREMTGELAALLIVDHMSVFTQRA